MATQQPTSAPALFIKRLRRALGGSGLSLRQAAERSGISPAFLSRLLNGERGLPTDEIVSKLEEVLEVQPRGLLFDAAGRQDGQLSKVLRKDKNRVLVRSLATLTSEDFAEVAKYAEQLAKKYHSDPQ